MHIVNRRLRIVRSTGRIVESTIGMVTSIM